MLRSTGKPFPSYVIRYCTWHLAFCSYFSQMIQIKFRFIATLDQSSVLHSCGASEGDTWAIHTFVAGRSLSRLEYQQEEEIFQVLAKLFRTLQTTDEESIVSDFYH